jgi:uncharacterized protein with NRDE domain
MCLILFAHRADPRYRLIVAANRDEFFRRPAAPAGFWTDAPWILGGRDLEKGGAWMGIARNGRWAAVTNFRDGATPAPGARSRGELVANYLIDSAAPQAYVGLVQQVADDYPGFNLLVGDRQVLHYLSNKEDGPMMLAPGIYGLSNGPLDIPWPKVERGKTALRATLDAGPEKLTTVLMAMLADRSIVEDHALPQTGVGRDWERRLSASFISAPGYGTRASTVLMIDHEGEVHFHERSFGEQGELVQDRSYRFALSAPATATG